MALLKILPENMPIVCTKNKTTEIFLEPDYKIQRNRCKKKKSYKKVTDLLTPHEFRHRLFLSPAVLNSAAVEEEVQKISSERVRQKGSQVRCPLRDAE